jgi:hypothetical protein
MRVRHNDAAFSCPHASRHASFHCPRTSRHTSFQPHSPTAVFGSASRVMAGISSSIMPSIDNDVVGPQPTGTGSDLGPGAFSPELNMWTKKPPKDASASMRKGGGGALTSRVEHLMTFDGAKQALEAHPHAGAPSS